MTSDPPRIAQLFGLLFRQAGSRWLVLSPIGPQRVVLGSRPQAFVDLLFRSLVLVGLGWAGSPSVAWKENIIKGVDKWWANGNIICNEHQRPREANSQVG